MKNKKMKLTPYAMTNIQCYGLVAVLFAFIYPMLIAGKISNSISGQLVPICCYIVLAVSLNMTVGILGELSLGHAGFMSVGAFTGITVATTLADAIPNGNLRLLVAVICGGIFAAIAGVIIGIPVLRLKGDYLAIVTLAFGEIIKNIVNCLYVSLDAGKLRFSLSEAPAGKLIINGPQGATGITKLSTFPAGIILIVFTLFVVLNFINSKTGRAVIAIRDNRIAAEACGINVTRYKLTAFVVSAALAGMAGTIYAMNYSMVAAKKFDFNTSILILVFVVLGGLGNIFGSIIATTVLYMLPELLRSIGDYRMLIYAIILIVVMLVKNGENGKKMIASVKAKTGGSKKKKLPAENGGASDE